ncbi:UNVERIFIED_ORG: hypothetical protein BDU10_4898 [Burkholderia sp. CF145]|nr:hypothetical protein PMI06_002749 [Burkholderia sp. BT03]SKC66800.1 hypothetical protein SAMN06266956_1591 [Paraburkholderia hospita]
MPRAAFAFGQLTLHVPFGVPFGVPFDGSLHTPFDAALSPKQHAKATDEPREANCPASMLRVEHGLQLIE